MLLKHGLAGLTHVAAGGSTVLFDSDFTSTYPSWTLSNFTDPETDYATGTFVSLGASAGYTEFLKTTSADPSAYFDLPTAKASTEYEVIFELIWVWVRTTAGAYIVRVNEITGGALLYESSKLGVSDVTGTVSYTPAGGTVSYIDHVETGSVGGSTFTTGATNLDLRVTILELGTRAVRSDGDVGVHQMTIQET